MKDRMTDQEVMALLRGNTPINRARKEFSSERARIDTAGRQRSSLSPIEMRRMEFEAIERIFQAHRGDST